MSEADQLRALLAIDGVAVPRVLVALHAAALAGHLRSGAAAPRDVIETEAIAAADQIWPQIGAATEVALRRAGALATPEQEEPIMQGIEWISDGPSANPVALALIARDAAALAAAMDRSLERLRSVEVTLERGGNEAALAAATAIGTSVLDLLDLDVEDYEQEVVDYVERDQSPEALDDLARRIDDPEMRLVARGLMRRLDLGQIDNARAAVAVLTEGDPPDDAAQDALWLPTVLALAEEAIALAMVQGGERPS